MRLNSVQNVRAFLIYIVAAVFMFGVVDVHAQDPVDTLKSERPRLLLNQEAFDDLKNNIKADPELAKVFERLQKHAVTLLNRPLPKYEKPDGLRLLDVSRATLERVSSLALLWRLTGEDKYLQSAKKDMFTVAAFPDWNPFHFLDTSEMATALAIGLDWLWPALTEQERSFIKNAIQRHAIGPYLSVHAAKRYGTNIKGVQWIDKDTNWNAVCNGGVLLAALSIADQDDLVSMNHLRAVLACVKDQLPKTIKTYSPDGAYPEGVMYWNYGSFYLAIALDAMQSALGTDFGLGVDQGLSRTGHFVLHAYGPKAWNLNYADSILGRRAGRNQSARLYFARRYRFPLLAQLHYTQAKLPEAQNRVCAWDLIWYTKIESKPRELAREALFRGKTPLAVWRSAWDDPNALYVSIIGGSVPVPHGHLDLGTFELRAMGQRWVVDQGKDDYGLPGYWEYKPGGRRWRYFNLGTQGHSVPRIAGKQLKIPSRADFTYFGGGEHPGAIIDLSEAYAPAKVFRGIFLLNDRQTVLVQDEFDGAEGEIVWGMTLNAETEVELKGDTATLKLGGKAMRVQALEPDGLKFRVKNIADIHVGGKASKGGKRLEFTIDQPKQHTTVRVWFSPVSESAYLVPNRSTLSDWAQKLKPVNPIISD